MLPGEQITRIGRYEIKGELGRGAMGVVYLGEDPTIGRRVALKTTRLDVHGSDAQDLLKRLRQEARAAGVLNHPNIVTIYDAGEENGLFYIAMEYIEGTTLQDRLLQVRTLPPDNVVPLARQICAGLDYAHARSIVHRDVKPANIMITADEVVKIMDFGVAKIGGGLTSTGSIVGTPSYMSPEQVCGKPLDGRTDLFSVGVILYECITGQKPFSGDNITTICYKIVHEDVAPPGRSSKSLAPGFGRAIMKALAKAPDERYQRGADLVRDLERAAGLGTVDGVPASSATGSVAWDPSRSGPARAASAPRQGGPPPPAQVPGLKPQSKPAVAPAPQASAPPRSHSSGALIATLAVVLLAAAAGGLYMWRTRQAENAAANPAPAPPSAAVPAAPPRPSAATPPPLEAAASPADLASPAAVPPSPAPTPTTAVLKIVTTPAGATVELDGKALDGETPTSVEKLDPGDHSVVITKSGYRTDKRTTTLEAGKQRLLAVVLTRAVATATIDVSSTPPGADIEVDGKPAPQPTPAQVPVSPGTHVVVVRKQGFQPAEANVNLQAGEKYKFAPDLHQAGGKGLLRRMFGGGGGDRVPLQVRTFPPGAQVLVDGTALPKTTPLRAPVPAGTHHLVIKLDGFRSIERDITVTKGQPLEIQERLRPQ